MRFLGKHIPRLEKDEENIISHIKKIMGFSPKNSDLYIEALTHASYQKKNRKGRVIQFQRLEFLGDAVLDLVVSEYFFKENLECQEGGLTEHRSEIVRRENLNKISKSLNLIDYMISLVDKNSFNEDINGDILEAFIGAMYIDKGLTKTKRFIYKHILRI